MKKMKRILKGESFMKAWKRIALVLAGALLLSAGLWACTRKDPSPQSSALASQADEDPTVFPSGTSIGGRDISGKTVEEALALAKKALEEEMASLEITVKFKDDTTSLSKEDFRTTDVMELTLPKLLASRRPEKYELSYVTDLSESGKRKLQEAAAACYAQGKDATVSGYSQEAGGFTFTDEQAGCRADLATTLKSVRQLLSQKRGGAIQAAFMETKPKLTKKYLMENFKLMSSYTTESTNTENGNSNMALALSKINGTILQPGQVFSYNGATGDSTDPSAGWKPAGGLSGGLSVQMYGGGICQGATTLYNAALMAGMEIVERDCHSKPSTYCPIGLDATVDYGYIDFKFRNPLSTPVYLSTWMDGVTLHANVFGCFPKEWDKVTLGSEQTGSEPARTDVSFREDENLAKGEYVRKSSGDTGYSARAWRIYYKGDEQVKTEELLSSYYAPTGVIYAVGAGTDTSKVDTSKESGNTEAKPSPSVSPSPSPEPEPSDDPEPTPEPTPGLDPEPSGDPGPGPEPTEIPDDSSSSGLLEW